jgi:hypothetical protein
MQASSLSFAAAESDGLTVRAVEAIISFQPEDNADTHD